MKTPPNKSGCPGGCPWCPRRILTALIERLRKLLKKTRGVVFKTRAIGTWWRRIGPTHRSEIIARTIIVVLVFMAVVPEIAPHFGAFIRHA